MSTASSLVRKILAVAIDLDLRLSPSTEFLSLYLATFFYILSNLKHCQRETCVRDRQTDGWLAGWLVDCLSFTGVKIHNLCYAWGQDMKPPLSSPPPPLLTVTSPHSTLCVCVSVCVCVCVCVCRGVELYSPLFPPPKQEERGDGMTLLGRGELSSLPPLSLAPPH